MAVSMPSAFNVTLESCRHFAIDDGEDLKWVNITGMLGRINI
jgi:hypothetical protein